MNVTKKLTFAFAPISLAAVGISLFATAMSSSPRNLPLMYAIAASGTVIALSLAFFLVGLSADRKLGAEPEELRRMATELAEGYLAPFNEEETKRQGAAGQLSLATAQLNTVFRATKNATNEVIAASHRIVSLALRESGGENELKARAREIAAQAEELAKEAQAFQEAIGYYSFDPRAHPEDKDRLITLKAHDERDQDSSMSAPRPQPKHKPSRGHKPKLRLLPKTQLQPIPGLKAESTRLSAAGRDLTTLHLIDPTEASRE
jgi:hypothetical protein